MAQTSTSPNFEHQPVETLFGQYLAANGKVLENRLAQQICIGLNERIAARRAELASVVTRAGDRTPEIRPLGSVKRQAFYAVH